MGNPKMPWVILNMAIGSPRIHRCVRENRRNCLRVASYGTCRSPFTNFRGSLCTFSSAGLVGSHVGRRFPSCIDMINISLFPVYEQTGVLSKLFSSRLPSRMFLDNSCNNVNL